MAALFAPAIGAHTSRQNELGYITHRAPAKSNTIKSFIVSISLILLYHLLDGSLKGYASQPALRDGWLQRLPNKLSHGNFPRSEELKTHPKKPTSTQYIHHTNHLQTIQLVNTLSGFRIHSHGRTKPDTTQNIHPNIQYTKTYPTRTTNRPDTRRSQIPGVRANTINLNSHKFGLLDIPGPK
jgi:hypothetical protein